MSTRGISISQSVSAMTRRRFIGGSAATAVAGSALLALMASSSSATAQSAEMPADTGRSGTRYVLRNGIVLSMDGAVGDFEVADVLIEGSRIVSVGPALDVGDAVEVDARGKIVMPGFIDTHHHQFQTALRSTLSEALLGPSEDTIGKRNYLEYMQLTMSGLYRPEDVYAAVYLSGLSQLDAGVTTVVDTSQTNHSLEHEEALVSALNNSKRRSVMSYSGGNPASQLHPGGARDLAARHFSSKDQLLTLAIGAEFISPSFDESYRIARELGLPIVSHLVGRALRGDEFVAHLAAQNLLGPEFLMIHGTNLGDDTWKLLEGSGVGLSVAAPIELSMRHGTPPIQQALNHGIQPSLSVDVESTMTADFFTQMRTVYTMQRGRINEQALAGEADLPALLTPRDVLRFATVEGARVAYLADKIGSLTPGKEADIILLDAEALNVAPVNNAAGAVVTLMERSNVGTVIVAGAIRKWQGKLVDVDIAKAIADVGAARDYLVSKSGIKPQMFE